MILLLKQNLFSRELGLEMGKISLLTFARAGKM